jgi:pyruvate formate lyase activating enzyme
MAGLGSDSDHPPAVGLPIGGFRPTTLVDYPDAMAATVFTSGCNFRCPFCHNPDLVLPERIAASARLDTAHVLETLGRRVGFLDAVVISGGEPTIHPQLSRFASEAKRLGLRIKLDTNGGHPDVLDELLAEGLVDYVAMDVKAPPAAYPRWTGVPCDLSALERSIDLIVTHASAYEFRTTVAPGLAVADLAAIAGWIRGAKRYVLQRFHIADATGLVDPSWAGRDALSVETLHRVWNELSPRFASGGVRE